MVKGREPDRLSEQYGGRFANHGCWSVPVPARSIGCVVPAVFERARHSRRGYHRSSGSGQPLRGGTREPRNRIQSTGPDAGFQLAGHHHRPETRRAADPGRGAVRGRTVTATRAKSSACVSRRASGLGQDAIYRDRRSPGAVGRVNRQFQAAKTRNRSLPCWREAQRFDLEASQSPVGRNRYFRLCGR